MKTVTVRITKLKIEYRTNFSFESRISNIELTSNCLIVVMLNHRSLKKETVLSFEHKSDSSYCIHSKNGTCNVS